MINGTADRNLRNSRMLAINLAASFHKILQCSALR